MQWSFLFGAHHTGRDKAQWAKKLMQVRNWQRGGRNEKGRKEEERERAEQVIKKE